jgi:virginiamycin B lyase
VWRTDGILMSALRTCLTIAGARRVRIVGLLAAAIAALALPASAGAFVYWTNSATGAIGRANLDGSSQDQGFVLGAHAPTGVAVDGEHAYWTNFNGTIARANLDGTGVDESFIAGANSPAGIAVDSAHIYWTNFNAGSIGRAKLDGTGADESFITGVVNPAGVAVDGAHVYWVNYTTGAGATIGRANLDGSSPNSSFITGANFPAGVAVDGAHVYWSNYNADAIGRANLDGTGADQAFITGADHPFNIALDGPRLYWANSGNNTIGRATVDGSTPSQAFVTGASVPLGVAADSLPHDTATSVACWPAPLTLPASATCTATVSDAARGSTAPSGTVTFGSSGAGAFTSGATCSLVATGAGQSTCLVSYAPSAPGEQTVTAGYSGGFGHHPSRDTATLEVLGPPKPSNWFTLSRPRFNRRKGTATLIANVPGPGRLVVGGAVLEKKTKAAKGAASVKLTLKPRKQTRRKLERTGRAKVKAKVTYAPTGGDPRTKPKRLTLRLRRHS